MLRVLVWNEFYHEQTHERAKAIYPHGIHRAIADFLQCDDIQVKTATLEDENCGITKEVLAETDVLIWWGHVRHNLVPNEVVELVRDAVLEGMGMIFLHSAHHSKPFKALLGTSCHLTWREVSGENVHVWTVDPAHPIAEGIPSHFELDEEEMYGEFFDIPTPDEIVFISWFKGGNVFRGGITFKRRLGKIFYFHPGHETLRSYHNETVIKVIKNAIRWAAPKYKKELPELAEWQDPIEAIPQKAEN